jgi:Spy/CpxP family protein refolding chaperone
MIALLARTRLLGFGLLAAAFVAGALSGAAVDRVISVEPSRERQRQDDRGDRDRRPLLLEQVDMSPAQREAIEQVLERRSERMRAVWREVAPRMDAIADSTRAEINEVLTPEQQAEYEELRRQWHERRDRVPRPDDAPPKPDPVGDKAGAGG